MNTKEAQIKAFGALEATDVESALAIKAASTQGESCFDDTTRGRMQAMLDPTFQPKAFAGATISPGIRICAAALELWGTSKIKDIEGARRFIDLGGCDPEDVMLMWSAGTERARLHEFAAAGITKIEVCASGCDDDTEACRADADKVFRLEDAPELPHLVDLDEEASCRCILIAKS
jgi:hypothetical protein